MGFSIILVAIGWLYVAVLMAVAEATSPVGTVLGALFTFLLYGALPVALIVYLMATPLRKKLRLKAENGEQTGQNPPKSVDQD
ncbi:MAG: hypothetical protein RL307_945 [Pseudomonadota bacterium]|jgi:hypothetical protein